MASKKGMEVKILKVALMTYGKFDVTAIMQVTYGNGSTQAFGEMAFMKGMEVEIMKVALVTYGKFDVTVIMQVTYGNGSMPAFGERLGPDDIENRTGYAMAITIVDLVSGHIIGEGNPPPLPALTWR